MLPQAGSDQPLVVYAGSMGLSHDPGWLVDVAVHVQSVDPQVRFGLVGKGALARAEHFDREMLTSALDLEGVLTRAVQERAAA